MYLDWLAYRMPRRFGHSECGWVAPRSPRILPPPVVQLDPSIRLRALRQSIVSRHCAGKGATGIPSKTRLEWEVRKTNLHFNAGLT